MIKKADIVLGILLLVAGLGLSFFIPHEGNQGSQVVIKQGDVVIGVYELNQDQELIIESEHSHNVIQIKDGQVTMEESSCPDQYCVKHKSISKGNQSIICLPNKIMVWIESDEEPEIDAIV